MHRSSASASLSNSGNGISATPRNCSRDGRWKSCLARTAHTAWYWAALAVGIQAGDASALTFHFSFTGIGSPISPATVSGTISGLVDNLDNQRTGLTAIITSATNTPPGGWPTFTNAGGQGFDVAGGQITGVDIAFSAQDGFELFGVQLFLGNQTNYRPQLSGFSGEQRTRFAIEAERSSLQFTTPSTSVPGPLPLFGAAAAFGWSRRLRRRVHSHL